VRPAAVVASLLLLAAGCTATPTAMPCKVYVAGSFTPENNYALSVEADGWPDLNDPGEWIELGFLAARPLTAPVDLVHVMDSHEIERWHLQVPTTQGAAPICRIAPSMAAPSCGASIRVQPQSPRGYYYLVLNGNAVGEVGMSFKLCAPQSS
jgi:hypothetical protein